MGKIVNRLCDYDCKRNIKKLDFQDQWGRNNRFWLKNLILYELLCSLDLGSANQKDMIILSLAISILWGES